MKKSGITKRLLTICVMLILISSIAISGTIAYITTSTESVTNTFEPTYKYSLTYNANTEDTVTDMPENDETEWISDTLHTFIIPTEDIPVREGYTFLGWNTKPDGSGVEYKPGEKVVATRENSDITLYAIWDEDKVTLSFDANKPAAAGSAEVKNMPQSISVVPGTKVTIPDTTPALEGYNFLGWAETPDGDTVCHEKDVYPSDGLMVDTKLYAKWATEHVDFGEIHYYCGSDAKMINHGDGVVECSSSTGNYEKLNIKLLNLEPGRYYRLRFNFDGLLNPLRETNRWRVGCNVTATENKNKNHHNYIHGDGGGVTSMWEHKYGRTEGFVDQVFYATAEEMWWVWDFSGLDEDPNHFTRVNLNIKQSLVIEKLDYPSEDAYLALPDATFKSVGMVSDADDVYRKETYKTYADEDELHANIYAMSGKHEAMNIPIKNLTIGQTYQVSFDIYSDYKENKSFFYGYQVRKAELTNSSDYRKDVGGNNVSEYVDLFGTSGTKTSTSVTFTATAETLYLSFPMNGFSDGNSYYVDITNASIKEVSPVSLAPAKLTLNLKGLTGSLPESVKVLTKGETYDIPAMNKEEIEQGIADGTLTQDSILYNHDTGTVSIPDTLLNGRIMVETGGEENLEFVFAEGGDTE